MTLEEILQPLCDLLRDSRIKSKQAAFDMSFRELDDARQLYAWGVIVDVIEKQSGMRINHMAAATMFRRSQKKNAGSTIREKNKSNQEEANHDNSQITQKTISGEDNASRLLRKLEERKKNEKRFIHDPTAKNISFNNDED